VIALDAASFATGLAYGAVIGACLVLGLVALLVLTWDEGRAVVAERAARRLSGNLPTVPVSRQRMTRNATAETMPTVPGLGAPASEGVELTRIREALERRTGETPAVEAA
jgi:hypothetical protein